MQEPTGPIAALLARCRERLEGRPDTEHEQAFIRLIVIAGMYAYMLLAPFPPEQRPFILFWSTVLYAAGLVASLAILGHILYRPGASPLRRVVGIVVDTTGINGAMLIGGHLTTPFYPLLLWIVFGHGFRYGNRYLFIASVLSLGMFGVVLLSNRELQQYTTLDLALVLSLIVLPGYVSILLKKLTDALERAEEASRTKSRFLATMSHEFRTPLNAIMGMTELLRRGASKAEQRDAATTIDTAARSLLGMVDALLRLARIEAGRVDVTFERFDLDSFLAHQLAMLRPVAAAKGIHLRLRLAPNTPVFVRGSSESLEHVLVNLVANAVKFTDHGGVTLSVAPCHLEGEREGLRFEVRDTGIGISREAQSRVFERFVQADEATRVRFGGSGLGLSIARELVSLMGGTIGVESTPGEGSTFWFEVPFTAEASDPARLAPPAGTVVVVGNALVSLGIAERLEALGVSTRIAATVASALDTLGRLEGRRAAVAIPPTSIEELAELAERLASRPGGEPIALLSMGLDLFDVAPPTLMDLPRNADDATLLRALHAALVPLSGPEPIAADAPDARPAIKAARVLFGEDNRVNQKVVSRLLEHAGHEVVVVDNGQAVLDRLDQERFDLVLLDVNMPDVTGPEVVKLLRFTHDPESLPPLVALSADATPETRELCLSLGFSRYLTKPVTLEMLASTIEELVPAEARSGRVRSAPVDRTPAEPRTAMETENVSSDRDRTSAGADNIVPHPALSRGERSEILDERKLSQIAELDADESFIKGLVQDFLEDGEKLVAELARAAEAGDVRAYRDAAHALRSSAAHIGARALYDRAREWRSLDDHALLMRAKNEARAVGQEFAKARDALRAYLRSRAS